MLRILILLLIAYTGVFATSSKVNPKVESYYEEILNMTPEQIGTLYSAYAYGIEDDLSLTLAAIVWKESKAGVWTINLNDGKYGSYSAYHINLEYAALRHNMNTSWGRSRLAERLLQDEEFAAGEALTVLKAYKTKTCNHHCTLAKYNGGNLGDKNNRSVAYANDVILRIKALDKYFNENKKKTTFITMNTKIQNYWKKFIIALENYKLKSIDDSIKTAMID